MLYTWFQFGQYFAPICALIYGVHLVVQLKTQHLLANPSSRFAKYYAISLMVTLSLVKFTYYCWVFTGGYVFFKYVFKRPTETFNLKSLARGMTVLTILNAIDVLRFSAISITFGGLHCICSIAARRFRRHHYNPQVRL